MKGVKITILSLIALLLLDSCSIQSRRYRKGFHVESLAKRSKSSTINTKEVNQLVKIASDKSEKQDLVSGKSDAESGDQVSSKAIAKKSATRKTSNKINLAEQYKTLKTFKKSLEDSLQKRNYPTLKTNSGQEDKYNKLAVASFVLVLSSLVLSFIPIIPGILFLLGFIFSIIALVQLKKEPMKGRGLAIAALVICCIFLFIFLIAIFAILATVA
jgi:hypothetical protein